MAKDTTSTNLHVLKPSRKKVREGDVFVVRPPDGRYLFGRVISLEAELAYMRNVVLLYFFERRTSTKLPVPWEDLTPENLLMSPVLTNKQGWYKGVFETVDHREIVAGDRLPTHCFYSPSRDRYFDEHNHELAGPVEPVGRYVLKSYRTIDVAISDVLGIPRA